MKDSADVFVEPRALVRDNGFWRGVMVDIIIPDPYNPREYKITQVHTNDVDLLIDALNKYKNEKETIS